jgi:hypothetical protein
MSAQWTLLAVRGGLGRTRPPIALGADSLAATYGGVCEMRWAAMDCAGLRWIAAGRPGALWVPPLSRAVLSAVTHGRRRRRRGCLTLEERDVRRTMARTVSRCFVASSERYRDALAASSRLCVLCPTAAVSSRPRSSSRRTVCCPGGNAVPWHAWSHGRPEPECAGGWRGQAQASGLLAVWALIGCGQGPLPPSHARPLFRPLAGCPRAFGAAASDALRFSTFPPAASAAPSVHSHHHSLASPPTPQARTSSCGAGCPSVLAIVPRHPGHACAVPPPVTATWRPASPVRSPP